MCITTPIAIQSPLPRQEEQKGLISMEQDLRVLKPVAPSRTMQQAPRRSSNNNTGRWKGWERLLFLKGLRLYGKGKWKQISEMISTRNVIQVKTHGQSIMKQIGKGVDVFAELNRYERFVEARKSVASPDGVQEEKEASPLSRLDPQDYDAARTLLIMRG